MTADTATSGGRRTTTSGKAGKRGSSLRGARGANTTHIFPDYGLVLAFTERNFTTPQVGGMVVADLVEKLKGLPTRK